MTSPSLALVRRLAARQCPTLLTAHPLRGADEESRLQYLAALAFCQAVERAPSEAEQEAFIALAELLELPAHEALEQLQQRASLDLTTLQRILDALHGAHHHWAWIFDATWLQGIEGAPDAASRDLTLELAALAGLRRSWVDGLYAYIELLRHQELPRARLAAARQLEAGCPALVGEYLGEAVRAASRGRQVPSLVMTEAEALTHHEGKVVTCVRFSQDGTWFASGDDGGYALAVNLDDDRTRAFHINPHNNERYDRAVAALAIHPSQRKVVRLNSKKDSSSDPLAMSCLTVHSRIWTRYEISQSSRMSFSAHGDKILVTAEFSDKSRTSCKLLDAANGSTLDSYPVENVTVADLSPDALVAVMAIGNTAHLYDLRRKEIIRDFDGHADEITDVLFVPDGQRALTTSLDRTARLWDLATGKELMRYEGHTSAIQALACAHDGRQLLTGGDDRTARLWDLETGLELRRLVAHTATVTTVDLSPDGRHALTGGADGLIHLWTLREPAPTE